MTTTTALATIAAALVSILGTSVIVRPTWSANRKRTIALVLAGTLGVVSAAVTGQLGLSDSTVHIVTRVVVMIAVVIVASQGFHRQFAGALGVLEKATSPTATVVTVAPDSTDPSEIVLDDEIPDAAVAEAASAYTPEHAADDSPSVVPDGEGVATSQS